MKKKSMVLSALFCISASLLVLACDNGTNEPNYSEGLVGEPELIARESIDDLIDSYNKLAAENDETSEAYSHLAEELLKNKNSYIEAIQQELIDDLDELNAYAKSIDPNASEITAADITAENGIADTSVETYKLTCRTRSWNGEWIEMSGTVSLSCASVALFGGFTQKTTLALHYSTSKGIVLHNHVTITSNSQCPSNASLTKTDSFIMRSLAFNDYFVVSPDYEGYGDTQGRIHPYLIQDHTARQCVDFLRAAIDWKKSKSKVYGTYGGLEKDFGTYSIGYSQGASVALAVQRHIENWNLSEELHFHGSYCGDGPYSPPATYKWYIENEKVYMPVAIALILRSYLPYYQSSHGDYLLKGYNLNTYFSEPFQNALARSSVHDMLRNEWCIIDWKTLDTDAINAQIFSWFGANPKKEYCTTEELLTADARNLNSDASLALLAALRKNDLTVPANWKNPEGPQHKVVVVHSKKDEVVPYKNLTELKDGFPDSKKIRYYCADGEENLPSDSSQVTKGRHENYGISFLADLVILQKDFLEVDKEW